MPLILAALAGCARDGPAALAMRNAPPAPASSALAASGSSPYPAPGPVVLDAAPSVVLSGLGLDGAGADAAASLLGPVTESVLQFAPAGVPIPWRDPGSGAHGEIAADPAVLRDGVWCRAYRQTLVQDGVTRKASGRACRQPDGTWRGETGESRPS